MKYTVEGGVAHIGTDMVLRLSAEQAAARAHALEKVPGGWRPTQVVQFKAGETIDIDAKPADLPRSLADVLSAAGQKRRGKGADAPAAAGGGGGEKDPGGEGGGTGE